MKRGGGKTKQKRRISGKKTRRNHIPGQVVCGKLTPVPLLLQ